MMIHRKATPMEPNAPNLTKDGHPIVRDAALWFNGKTHRDGPKVTRPCVGQGVTPGGALVQFKDGPGGTLRVLGYGLFRERDAAVAALVPADGGLFC